MPQIAPQVRAQGGFSNAAEPWPDHDWSVPTDLETLRHRVLEAPDQSRYDRIPAWVPADVPGSPREPRRVPR